MSEVRNGPHGGDRYRMLDAVGKGGMGTVRRAMNTRSGRAIALKRLHHTLGRVPRFPTRRLP